MKTSISQQLCAGYRDTPIEAMEPRALERAKLCTLDLLGNAIGASTLPTTEKLKQALLLPGYSGGCAVCVDERAPAERAAFINGSAGHSFDMDDQFLEAGAHPAVAVIPAALAAAEERGATGLEFLAAVVWGYDLLVRIGHSFTLEEAFKRGWHPCSCVGVFGAALAASFVMGSSAEQMANALGIAGSFASGNLECYGDGSNTKRLQPGHAAAGGTLAARLGSLGYRGPLYIFEGERNFVKTYFGGGSPENMLEGEPDGSAILRGAFKPYAACRGVHPSVDVIRNIMKEHRLAPEEIVSCSLDVPSSVERIVVEPRAERYDPVNPDNAQFSLPYCAACALLFGDLSIRHFTDELLHSAPVREMMSRIHITHTGEMDRWQPYRLAVKAEITTADGRVFTEQLINCKGDPENPMSREELIEKFLSLCELAIPRERARTICDAVFALDAGSSIRELTKLL